MTRISLLSFALTLLLAACNADPSKDKSKATVAEAVGMKRDELQGIWPDYVYRVRLDDRLVEILNMHAAWRLASGNHPPGAVMPDFSKVIALEPLKTLDPARVTLSSK